MEVIVLGIVIDSKSQPQKVYSSIVVTEGGKAKAEMAVFLKAPFSILVTVLGKFIDLRERQL